MGIHPNGNAPIPLDVVAYINGLPHGSQIKLALLLHVRAEALGRWLQLRYWAPKWRIKQIEFAIEEGLI